MTDPNMTFDDLFETEPSPQDCKPLDKSSANDGAPAVRCWQSTTNDCTVPHDRYNSISQPAVLLSRPLDSQFRQVSAESYWSHFGNSILNDSGFCESILSKSAPPPHRPDVSGSGYMSTAADEDIHNYNYMSRPRAVILSRRSAEDAVFGAPYGGLGMTSRQQGSDTQLSTMVDRTTGLRKRKIPLDLSATGRRTQSMSTDRVHSLAVPSPAVDSGESDFSCSAPSSPAIIDPKTGKRISISKSERSRESARECRARKKFRIEWLAEYNKSMERANQKLYDELASVVNMAHRMDAGEVSAEQVEDFLRQLDMRT